jgi:hypothetical protein
VIGGGGGSFGSYGGLIGGELAHSGSGKKSLDAVADSDTTWFDKNRSIVHNLRKIWL